MNQTELAFFLIIIAGLFQGTFGIFIKNIAPLKWENFWIIFSFFAYLLGPFLFAYFQIQNLFPILFSLPLDSLYLPFLFGMIWGIGAVMFGLCVVKIGVSLTYSIILGLVTMLGSILPIFINHITFTPQALTFLIIGLVIIISGVVLSGFAGILKDRILNPKQNIALDGIILAVISGIVSSFLNVGFILGKDVSLHAQTFGISETNSSSLIWLVVLFGGFITNFGYALLLIFKNKTLKVYQKLTVKMFFPIFISAVFWYATFALFGIGSTRLGKLGPSVGWAMLIALSIVVSNVWGIKFKEWKGVKKALKIQLGALGLTIVGVVFVTLSAF